MPKQGHTTKNKKIVIALVLAVLFAAIAGFGVYQLLTPQRTTVYIFNGDYSAGTQVTSNMLSSVEVDSHVVNNGMRASTGDYIITSQTIQSAISSAGYLRSDVYAGNIFTSSMLSSTGGNRIERTMKKDAVAVTVGVNNVTGVTNNLSQSSRVNVYANYNDATTLLLQNVRVLSTARDNNGNILTITLEVSSNDSLKLIYAYNYGSIHLGLVDYNGYQAIEGASTYNGGSTNITP